ncbi:flagellar export protein FliJ [Alkalihalophilus pseudofirmus]|uniref:flagellar export protein FliJ n=1 Tax=Alkalihalobacterium alkalinitrilicum TaxID=427920 RepID=UPI00094C6FF1|nr:flagellar export protein FliJ [Alkalihalobacterium alkalinitrilicum]OLO40895.1 flagellar export protein FliJ [Alkalihalophilus pseudofirmus]
MSFRYTLQKVLDIKDREKKTSENEYNKATKQFEEMATRLYDLLKKKEDLESSCQQQMNQGIPIHQLQQHQTLLMRLNVDIDRQQQSTNLARNIMYQKQEDFVEASIELKKYEKMKEIRYEEYIEEQKRMDNMRMDEISLQLYVNR